MKQFALGKRHKLCSRRAIDSLFIPGNDASSAIAFPLRAVWRKAAPTPTDNADTQPISEAGFPPADRFLVSIPKKRLRKAVDRVRMRRLVREAYRLNHASCRSANCHAESDGARQAYDIAFVYVANDLRDFASVERAVIKLLKAIRPSSAAIETQTNVDNAL